MDFAALKVKLNTKLSDTDNFAFSSAEKDEILTEAMQDSYVVKTIWDSSLTFVTNTWSYTLPSTLTTLKDIYIKPSSNSDPEKISLKWEVVDGNIQFSGGSSIIPDASVLYLKGNYKYTISDTIGEIRTQQYVLNLAQLIALDDIGVKKIMKFVKNDSTVSDMIRVKRELERKVSRHRASLPKEFQAM